MQSREPSAGNARRVPAPWIVGIGLAVVGPLAAEPVRVPPTTAIELELQHHVTAGYMDPGEPIWFRVARDVQVEGRTVVKAGTPAKGRMIDATERGMVGRSGSMSLGVRHVQAVDGSWLPVEADLARQGRSRTGATVGWVLVWGIPGLITKGVNPYLERGTTIDASLLAEVTVDPDKPPTAEATVTVSEPQPLPLLGYGFAREGTRFVKSPSARVFEFDIERDKQLPDLVLLIEPPPDTPDPSHLLETVELVSVDGAPVPEPVLAMSATATTARFDGWPIIRYLSDGTTRLGFRARGIDGKEFYGEQDVIIRVTKKVPKKKAKAAA